MNLVCLLSRHDLFESREYMLRYLLGAGPCFSVNQSIGRLPVGTVAARFLSANRAVALLGVVVNMLSESEQRFKLGVPRYVAPKSPYEPPVVIPVVLRLEPPFLPGRFSSD